MSRNEAAAVFNMQVTQWREILPVGGMQRASTLPVGHLHPGLVGMLYPPLIGDVYQRVLVCLTATHTPVEPRREMLGKLSMTDLLFRVSGYYEPDMDPEILQRHKRKLHLALHWLGDEVNYEPHTLQMARQVLLALAVLVSAEFPISALGEVELAACGNALITCQHLAEQLREFVAEIEPQL